MRTPEPPDADDAPIAGGEDAHAVLSGDVPDHVAVEVDAPGMPPVRADQLEQAVAEALRRAGPGSAGDLGTAIARAVSEATGGSEDTGGGPGNAAAEAITQTVTRALSLGRIVAIAIVVVVLVVAVNVALRVFDIVGTTTDIVRDVDVPDVVPRAESIELVDDGDQLVAAIDEIAAANGAPTAVDVTAYPQYLLACMVAPDGATQGYRFDAHGLDRTGALCPSPGDDVFSVRRVAWQAVPRLADRARTELGGEPGEVTHVIVDRSLGSGLEIRVYFRADSGSVSGYVSAERDGTLTRVCC